MGWMEDQNPKRELGKADHLGRSTFRRRDREILFDFLNHINYAYKNKNELEVLLPAYTC